MSAHQVALLILHIAATYAGWL